MSTCMNITDLNIPENLRTGDRISCRMGDETIEAEVTIAPKAILVQLKVFWHEIRATRRDSRMVVNANLTADACNVKGVVSYK